MPLFDEDGKITLFVVAAAAFLLTATLDRAGPREDLETAIDTGRLPALPLSARPDGTPAQTRVAAMQVALGDGFEARLLHGYVLEGRVVSRREFRNDATSAVSPLDLGIVWGDLAEDGATDELSFRAGQRVLWTRFGPEAELPRNWEEQVTNNHLIPANQSGERCAHGSGGRAAGAAERLPRGRHRRGYPALAVLHPGATTAPSSAAARSSS
jgi:hypothetical protein